MENGSYFEKAFAIKKIRGDKLTFKSTSDLKKQRENNQIMK